jgi:hypothetical protein
VTVFRKDLHPDPPESKIMQRVIWILIMVGLGLYLWTS